ncbi:galactose oxidase [Gigaspora margarita]|uniref:Galactose oxidase n=1 Tax=Gigaspora margarita TaxID=4874 RepID=A0A8H4AZJ7_GIGMA|nr:galactose oxidase [Gigaspora margarita]
MSYLSFFYIITLLLLNYIHPVQNQPSYFSGGSEFKSYYTDGNSVIDSSKWIQVTMNKNISLAEWPFLGGISNENLFFATSASYGTSAGVYIDIFDTTSNQWKTNLSFTGKPNQYFEDFKLWITDGSTGKAYSLQDFSKTIEIFDTLSLSSLNGPLQGLLPSGVILYFASETSSSTTFNDTISMSSILSYNVKTNSWQFVNATGQILSLRSDYTAVSTSDGRVIIYGGTSNKLPATPSIVVLNTSNYVWSTPSEINPIGPLTKHTSIMINNYMIAAFGVNVTERNSLLQNNKHIYKLDISDSLTYKWSVLSVYSGNLATITKSILPPSATPNSATPNSKFSSLPNYSSSNNSGLFLGVGVVAAVVIILAFAGVWFYKRSKAKYIANTW